MTKTPIRWIWAAVGALVAEVGQIAAAIGWIAIYSHVINPGLPLETYESHAQFAAPWVSIVAGVPIFYAASRWIAKSTPSALALYGIFLVVDLALVVAMSDSTKPELYGFLAASYLTKLAACFLGGQHSESARSNRESAA
jgi:hypothetical protein